MKSPILTEKEFKAVLANFPRVSKKMIKAVRLVLVEGHTQAKAAEMCGMHKALLNRRVIQVRDKYLDSLPCPRGWRLVQLCVPPTLEDKLSEFEDLIDGEIVRLRSIKSIDLRPVRSKK